MFPVAFAGGLKVEGPICTKNGTTAASWHVAWAPERYMRMYVCIHVCMYVCMYVCTNLTRY